MPNCCFSRLTLIGKNADIQQVFDFIRGSNEDGSERIFDFNKVIPEPRLDDIWYNWNYENWGTDSNSVDTERHGNSMRFWTAWSPCTPVIQKLSEFFPDVSFHFRYVCQAGFEGFETWENGKLVFNKGGK